MTSRTNVHPLGFGLSAVLCFTVPGTADAPPPRPPVRVYTNEDLERIRPLRDETGIASVPAVPASTRDAATDGRTREKPRGHGEEYWRREAERTRERVRRLEDQAEALRGQIAREQEQQSHISRHARRSSELRGFDRVPSLQARLAALERRCRALEEELADRARRDGALPGWLR
jgi:hypothetical protein